MEPIAYLLTRFGGFISVPKLHIAKASRRVILVNRAPCTNDLAKLGKRIMQVLVCPASREALDKDVAILLA